MLLGFTGLLWVPSCVSHLICFFLGSAGFCSVVEVVCVSNRFWHCLTAFAGF